MEKNTIGLKIGKRRAELLLTQRQVADYVGVTEATVSRWESGKIDNMRRDKIAKLANILMVSPLLIMGIEDIASNVEYKNSDENGLVKGFRSLSADGKNTLLNVLNGLLASQQLTSK